MASSTSTSPTYELGSDLAVAQAAVNEMFADHDLTVTVASGWKAAPIAAYIRLGAQNRPHGGPGPQGESMHGDVQEHRHFFRPQDQNDFQSLHPNFMDDGVHDLARALDHVDDREQDVAIGFTKLLDDGGLLLGGTRDDLIGFTQGGWLLSDSRFSSTGF
jgi:hypothetical protein